MWDFDLVFWINVVTFFSSVTVALLTLLRKKFPGQLQFILLMIMAAEWSLFAAFEAASLDFDLKILFSVLLYPGAMSVSVLFFYFVINYTVTAIRYPKLTAIFLWIIPISSVIMAATNRYHHLLWANLEWHPIHKSILIYNHGVWFYISLLYSLIVLLVAIYYLIRNLIKYPDLYKHQIKIIILGALFPAITEIIYALGLSPVYGLDISPLGFLFSGIFLLYGFSSSKLFNIVPVAREKILDIIKEGITILDDSDRVLDMNYSALKILDLKTAPVGKKFYEVVPETKEFICNKTIESAEISIQRNAEVFLEFVCSGIKEMKESFSGKVITFRNISEKKQSESALKLSEDKYKLITENISDVIWIMDLSMKITYVSPSIKTQRGFTQEEFLSLKTKEIYTEESYKKILGIFNEHKLLVEKNKLPLDYEYFFNAEMKCKDGSVKPCEVYVRLLNDTQDKIIGVQGVTRDISNRIQDHKIQNSRLKLHQLAAAKPLDKFLQSMLDEICNLVNSPIGFFHYIINDEKEIFLQAWSTNTIEKFCSADKTLRKYPIEESGIWTDCLIKRKPVIHNEYNSLKHKKGLPDGHSLIDRLLTVPVFQNDKIVAILGVGNKSVEYNEKDVDLVNRFADFAWEITERKRAEDSLIASEERLRTLINSIPDIICFKDDKGRWLLANDTLLELYNLKNINYFYKTELELSKLTSDIYHESLIHCLKTDEQAWEKGGIFVTEEIIPDVSGKKNIFDIYKIPIYNEDKSRKGLVIFGHNITERKKAEEKISLLLKAVDQSPVSIIITDYDGTIEYVNPRFTELTEYKTEEVIGKNPRILNSQNNPKELYTDLWNTIKQGNIWQGEFINKKKSGEIFIENALISPITDLNGNITQFIAIKEDITERKKIESELIEAKESAEEMNRIKSYFFANMSHELRTPMVGILGFSEVLKNLVTDEEARQMAEGIYMSSNRLMETLNHLLDFNKIDAGKDVNNYSEMDIIKISNESIILFEISAVKKEINLELEIKAEPGIIVSDERKIRQIISNLLNNAIKYTNEGGVKLVIDESFENQNRYLIIKVIDTGIGIPKDKQNIIWEEFRQVSEGISRNYEGTGLGLTLTKRFVENLGGTIFVESAVRKGTTFTVKLPIGNSLFNPTQRKKINSKVSSFIDDEIETISQTKILYVENEEVSRKYIGYILKNLFTVDFANNGDEALEKVKSYKYKLILMDINLGQGLDGLEVTQKIREIKQYKNTPIIAVTAFAQEEDRLEFLDKGCTDYISKPFSQSDLINLINKYLD